MGADNSTENIPSSPEFICSICLPKPKSSAFQWKKTSLGSIVRGCVNVKIRLHKRIHPMFWTPSLVLDCSGPHFPCGPHLQCNAFSLGNSFIIWCWISHIKTIQGNNYEIVINFFHISHNLTWYSTIVNKFTRIYPVCSTYELAKQFM